MSRKVRKHSSEFVEPDLPIVPMLDMSFQLMAFFLITFHPAPTEGQMALALPSKEGGGVNVSDPLEDPKTKDVIVQVYAGAEGKIRKIDIEDGNSGTKNLGASIDAYQQAVQAAATAALKSPEKKIGKLKLQIEKSLLNAYVVQLLDHAIRAGFTDISPEPLDDKKAAAG